MQIFIDNEALKPLVDALEEAPLSDDLKKLIIDEFLTSPKLRKGSLGVPGLFDGADISATGTGDFVLRCNLTRGDEMMTAAFRALARSAVDDGGH